MTRLMSLLAIAFGTAAYVFPIQAAEICTELEVLGGTGTTQTKTVTIPSIPFIPFVPFVINNNWNTDFFVPGGKLYANYAVEILPKESSEYGIEINLKYSDNTFVQSYKNNVTFKQDQPLRISVKPRPNSAPYQVNVHIGGLDNATGTTYDLTVSGCNPKPKKK
jgi:hypothetical protein